MNFIIHKLSNVFSHNKHSLVMFKKRNSVIYLTKLTLTLKAHFRKIVFNVNIITLYKLQKFFFFFF